MTIGAFGEDVLSTESLRAITEVTAKIAQLDDVERVRSISNVRVATSTNDDVLIERAVDVLSPEQIRTHPLLGGKLISTDGRATLIIASSHPRNKGDQERVRRLAVGTQDILQAASEGSSLKWAYAGQPRVNHAFSTYSERDLLMFGPLLVLIVVFVSWLVFRRLGLALIPLPVVVLANAWTFGLIGTLDWAVNAVTTGVVILILAVGVADSIHIISEFGTRRAAGDDVNAAIAGAIDKTIVPCLFTSLTTVAGMLSLLVSEMPPIRQFGVAAAVGVMSAFLLSITVVPALLSFTRAEAKTHAVTMFAPLIARLARPSRRSSVVITTVFAVLVVASAIAVASLQVSAGNSLSFFLPEDPIRRDATLIDASLGGTGSIEVVIRATDGDLLDPAKLAHVAAMQQQIDAIAGVSWSVSYVDMLRDVYRTMTGTTATRLPRSRSAVSQLALLLDGEDDFDSYLREGYTVGRTSHVIRLSRSETLIEGLAGLRDQLRAAGKNVGLSVELTGVQALIADTETYLVRSQSSTFTLALIVITVMLIVLLRSVRLGLLSMVPNCGPIIIGLGGMSLVGIPLDPGTVMVGSICLGLVVDDTVHFLNRVREARATGATPQASIEVALHATAGALITTTIVLAAGFGVFALSSFMPNRNFGLISAAIVIIAIVADLVVLPAMLLVTAPKSP